MTGYKTNKNHVTAVTWNDEIIMDRIMTSARLQELGYAYRVIETNGALVEILVCATENTIWGVDPDRIKLSVEIEDRA